MIRPQQIALQTDFKKIPELFDRNDFEIMVNSIEHSKIYPRDIFWKSWMKARDKTILSCLFFMGLRPKEACSLRYDDFNKKLMAFLIRGENNKEKKDRIMPLPNALIPYLLNYLQYGRFSNYLFPSFEDRGKPISSSTWKRIMREKILKPSGLWIAPESHTMPRTRSYSLRMSYATRLLKTTKDLNLVALAMGHSDFRSLNRYIYLNNIEEDNIKQLRDFDANALSNSVT